MCFAWQPAVDKMKASDYFRGITVEPTIFLNALGLAFSGLTVQNLLVQKTCYPDIRPPIALICNDTLKVGEATGDLKCL